MLKPPYFKVCKVCGKTKTRAKFTKENRNVDGLGSKCLICFSIRHRELYPGRKRKRTTEENIKHNEFEKKRRTTLNGWAAYAIRQSRKYNKCNLTKDKIIQLWEKQKGQCAITKMKMELITEPRAHNRPSIDRIDNSKGYTINNIRLVWYFVNIARSTFSDEEFIKCCKAVVNGQNR